MPWLALTCTGKESTKSLSAAHTGQIIYGTGISCSRIMKGALPISPTPPATLSNGIATTQLVRLRSTRLPGLCETQALITTDSYLPVENMQAHGSTNTEREFTTPILAGS